MAQAATTREGKGGISLPAIRVTAQRQPAPLRAGAGSAPPADHGSEAGAPERASSKGRARPVKELNLSDFEALVVETAQRLLAGEHANTATLRPSQVAKLLGLKDAALYSAVADILKHHPELDGWRLARVKRRNSLVYLRYERAVLRCPLCGKLVRRHSAPAHAFTHIEKLERTGALQLSRENGGWVIYCGGSKYFGAGWRTLILVAEKLAREGEVVASG
jgi:hypothetical protein